MAIPQPTVARIGTFVRDVMQYHVVTVPPEMTVRELVQTLADEGISGAPVLDAQGTILGVVSATDVIRLASQEAEIPAGQVSWEPVLLAEEAEDAAAEDAQRASPVSFTAPDGGALAESSFDELTVRDIMTPAAFTVRPDDPIANLVELLVRGRIHRALVVEDGVLLGIVTPFDVLRHDYGG